MSGNVSEGHSELERDDMSGKCERGTQGVREGHRVLERDTGE